MYKTGVYFGRFCPPHRGHLYQMIEASTQCEKLIVVISDNANQTKEICQNAGLPYISYQLRKQWISQQIQDMEHITVRVLDESAMAKGSRSETRRGAGGEARRPSLNTTASPAAPPVAPFACCCPQAIRPGHRRRASARHRSHAPSRAALRGTAL